MFGINGLSLPKISLPKIDLGAIGKKALSEGVNILKGVAKDMFTPAKDGQHLFKTDVNAKVGPFDIKLKNPVEVLAEKLLGKAGDFLKSKGIDTGALGGLLGGSSAPRTVTGAGDQPIELPTLPERVQEYQDMGGADGAFGVGGGTGPSASDATPIAPVSAAPTASTANINSVDFGDRAIEKFGGGISGLDKQIDDMLAKGGDLSSSDQIKLQRLMQKRSELFQLLTQIMQMEHETKKNIIANIR